MASISRNEKTGLSMLLVICKSDGKRLRRRFRLGRITALEAEDIRLHVRHLASCRKTGSPLPPLTAEWLGAVPDTLRAWLVLCGLAVERAPVNVPVLAAKPTLKPFLDGYMATLVDLKESTRVAMGHTVKNLVDYFGADRPLDSITAGDAKAWRRHLAGEGEDGEDLADNTVRRRSGLAKQFFRAAVDSELLIKNPFAALVATVKGNKQRQFNITPEMAEKVLAACPDAEWRTIFALCRYGGLRCPSEVLALTWDDIHWDADRLTVHASKTEHHEGGGIRQVPLFPELRVHLREMWEQAKPGTVFVINRYRRADQNLRTKLLRIIRQAGLVPWPKLFVNLRSTRATELVDAGYSAHKVCQWMGHGVAVALAHYWQDATADDFRQAANGNREAAQKAAQYGAESALPERKAETADVQKTPDLPNDSESFRNVHKILVGATGLEPVTSSL